MGEVIQFPNEAGANRDGRYAEVAGEAATVIILPVVRIERDLGGSKGQTHSGHSNTRRRRRRVAR